MNVGCGIGAPRGGGDILRVRALVMGRGADDRVEGRRQRADDLVGLLVARRRR